jgi:endoglucanase
MIKLQPKSKAILILIGSVILAGLSCNISELISAEDQPPLPAEPVSTAAPDVSSDEQAAEPEAEEAAPPPISQFSVDKWSLWASGKTQLRGANIYQRVVLPDLDGEEFLGSDPFGPPFTQEDFDRLAALGANYVNISGPGLYGWDPPYGVNEAAVAHMDNLLAMIEKADMFAVITARSGPGRSPFAITRWVTGKDKDLLVETLWEDEAAQQAYVDMWRYTADHYRDNPIVVGYDLMCEPNVVAQFEIWEPDEFYAQYGGTSYDWNQLHPRITAAIREVDADTPILVGGEGWSGLRWLPYVEPTGDPHSVYMVHQYEPQDDYTHQRKNGKNTYPDSFDLDWDGSPDPFDRNWLDGFLMTIDEYQQEHDVIVGVNEFGVHRWVPGGAQFMTDQMDLFEERGMNHALWSWDPSWEYWTEEVNDFNFRFGPDPKNISEVPNELMEAIKANWSLNTIFPSTYAE